MKSTRNSVNYWALFRFIQRCDSTAYSPLIADDNNKLKMSISSNTPFRLNACIQTLEESEGDSDVFDNQGAFVNNIHFFINKNVIMLSLKMETENSVGLWTGKSMQNVSDFPQLDTVSPFLHQTRTSRKSNG